MFKPLALFWNTQPCNVRHSTKKVGTKEYFDEVEKKKYFVEPHIPIFAEFPRWKNKQVFEVGCGIGTDAKKFCEAGADYTGIDISKKSVKLTQKRLKEYKLEGEVICGNIEDSIFLGKNFDLEVYDLVYSFGVLHHTPNISNAISNIQLLLKPGGIFKMMVYAKHSWKYWKIKEGLDQFEAQKNVPIANVFTKAEIYNLLLNFKNITITQQHIFPYKIPEYKKHQYVKEDYFKEMPEDIYKMMEKRLGWHLCVTGQKK